MKKTRKKNILNLKKEKEKNIEDEKILITTPRKLLLGVTEASLASELAFHISKYTNIKCLLIDADGLNPSVAINLGMKDLINYKVITEMESNSAFNMAMDYISRTPKLTSSVLAKIAVQHSSNKNLFVLTGNDDLTRYEGYSESSFELLLKYSTEYFDLVIVNVPYNVYDLFYLKTLESCNYMLYGFEPFADKILEYNSLVTFLEKCNRSDITKHQYVPFQYNGDHHLSIGDIKAAMDNNVLSCIYYSEKRIAYRNKFNKSYANNMSNQNIKNYHRLSNILGYPTKKKIFGRRI